MTASATRLTWRMHRFEVRMVLLATALSVVVTAIVTTWMQRSGYSECLAASNFGQLDVACLNLLDAGMWFDRIARASMGLVPMFPFLAGLLLGGPIIARELDRGTARLAWSLSPSRLRWFVDRLLPMFAIVLVSAVVIAIVADWLVALYSPDTDLSQSFVGYGSRGLLVVSGALVIGSTAVFLGSIVGRLLPTLLLALILGGLTQLAVGQVHRQVLVSEAVPGNGEFFSQDDLYIDDRFQLPDGSLRTWDELVALDPTIMETGPLYPYVPIVIPGNRYRAVEIREASAQLAIAGLYLVGAAVVVTRRRPG